MAIPDEHASLTRRLSQMKDSVGPQSTRHHNKQSLRLGIWGGSDHQSSNRQIKERLYALEDSSGEEHTLMVENGAMA